jgi:hypothetical protein
MIRPTTAWGRFMSSRSFERNMGFADVMIADHEALHALDDLEALFDWASLRSRSSVYIRARQAARATRY